MTMIVCPTYGDPYEVEGDKVDLAHGKIIIRLGDKITKVVDWNYAVAPKSEDYNLDIAKKRVNQFKNQQNGLDSYGNELKIGDKVKFIFKGYDIFTEYGRIGLVEGRKVIIRDSEKFITYEITQPDFIEVLNK